MDNLYSATQADLTTAPSDGETYSPQFLSVHGRLGRLRYLAYTWLSAIVLSFISGIISAIVIPIIARSVPAQSTFLIAVVAILIYIPIIAASLIFTKRRLNDLDHSGWFSVLMLVPFLNLIGGLYLLFAPGTSSNNRYGAKPEKNSGLLIVAGIIVPIAVVGILAAIAIPAYQKYTERAKAAAMHQAP